VFGKVHLLCNNAGVSLFGPMDLATPTTAVMMGVNVDGVIQRDPVLHAAPQGARRRRPHRQHRLHGGTSGSDPAWGLYSASKFAVVGFDPVAALTIWRRTASGVSVLCPGFVRSNIHEAVLSRPKNLGSNGITRDGGGYERLDGNCRWAWIRSRWERKRHRRGSREPPIHFPACRNSARNSRPFTGI